MYRSDIENMTTKENTLTFKCVDFRKNFEKKFLKELDIRLQNTHRLCD